MFYLIPCHQCLNDKTLKQTRFVHALGTKRGGVGGAITFMFAWHHVTNTHFTSHVTCHSSTERMRVASHQVRVGTREVLFLYVRLVYFHLSTFDQISPMFARSPIFTYFAYVHLCCEYFLYICPSIVTSFFTCVSQSVQFFTSSWFLFTYFHLFSPIFTHFHLFSPIFTYFHLFHLISPIFTYFHLFSPIFTYFHPFSPIFTYFHLFSPKKCFWCLRWWKISVFRFHQKKCFWWPFLTK